MERMDDVEEMLREMSEKYKNSKSVEVYEEDLEGWFKIIDDLREENEKLKEELKKTNELLSNVARCAEQYRGKMISVMEELKMFLYKD